MAKQQPVVEELWNNLDPEKYPSNEYQKHILEQYKILVETADKVTDRRNQINAFFLSVNTLVLTVFALIYDIEVGITEKLLIIPPLIAVLGICVLWFLTLLSYRKLNKAKFAVINDGYEPLLPSRPFHSEWIYATKLKRPEVTIVEMVLPWLFIALYIFVAVILFLS